MLFARKTYAAIYRDVKAGKEEGRREEKKRKKRKTQQTNEHKR